MGFMGGGGGTGSTLMAGTQTFKAGDSEWGGGGGCGSTATATIVGTAGKSVHAGDGANSTYNAAGLDGNAPGGGGGGSLGAATTGKGGDGRALIVTLID